jgi:hypothetical protein
MRIQSRVLSVLGFLMCMAVTPARAAADPVRLLFSFTGDDLEFGSFSGSFTLDPAALKPVDLGIFTPVFKGQTVLNLAISNPTPRETTRTGDLLLFVANGEFIDALNFFIEPFNTPQGTTGEFQARLEAEDPTARGLTGSGLPDFTRFSFEPFTLSFIGFDPRLGPFPLDFIGGPVISLTVTPLPDVPEPSTVLLVGGALTATMWRARRRA